MQDTLAALRSAGTIHIEDGCAIPQTLSQLVADSVVSRPHGEPLEIFTGVILTSPPWLPHVEDGRIRVTTPMPGRGLARASEHVRALPVGYPSCAQLYGSGVLVADAVAVSVSADHSLGVQVGFLPDVIEAVRSRGGRVFVEVNTAMPHVAGAPVIDLDGACVVQSRIPLVEDRPRPAGPVELEIADRVASIVPDGACLQVGIGVLGDAVLGALVSAGRRRLSVHSGMLGDGMVDLAATEAMASETPLGDPPFVTAMCIGSNRLFSWAARDPRVRVADTHRVHAPAVTSRIERFVSVNFALQVDLQGNVNAEAVGRRVFSGPGGQLDFATGATAAPEGRSIVALSATTPRGESKIVTELDGPTTTPATRVHFVATEHGVADLRTRTAQERARALAAIAAPEHRTTLLEAS